jgi:predicted HTH domain antitoxin
METTVTLTLPSDIAERLSADGRDLSRAALEALAVEEYRAKRLTHVDLGRILNLSRIQVDDLLHDHEVWLDYDLKALKEDLAQQPE